MKKLFTLFTVILFSVSANAEEIQIPAGSYTLDKSHASLVFNVSHIGFSKYTMSFDKFDAKLEFDPIQPEKSKISATIDPTSLDLPNPPKGFTKTMLGVQWLNAKAFPKIIFTSNKVEVTGDKTAKIYGEFVLLGVKKEVVLDATFNGGYAGHPMDPNARIGFSATGRFNRSDFGMTYGIPAPGTTMGVGDEINFAIEAEFSGPALKTSKD